MEFAEELGPVSQVEVVSNAPRLLAMYEKSGYLEVQRTLLKDYMPEEFLTEEEIGLEVVVMQKRKGTIKANSR